MEHAMARACRSASRGRSQKLRAANLSVGALTYDQTGTLVLRPRAQFPSPIVMAWGMFSAWPHTTRTHTHTPTYTLTHTHTHTRTHIYIHTHTHTEPFLRLFLSFVSLL